MEDYDGICCHSLLKINYRIVSNCKPMGDLPYISSEQGVGLGLQCVVGLYTNFSVLYLYKNFELKRGGGLIIVHQRAYNKCYTV